MTLKKDSGTFKALRGGIEIVMFFQDFALWTRLEKNRHQDKARYLWVPDDLQLEFQPPRLHSQSADVSYKSPLEKGGIERKEFLPREQCGQRTMGSHRQKDETRVIACSLLYQFLEVPP